VKYQKQFRNIKELKLNAPGVRMDEITSGIQIDWIDCSNCIGNVNTSATNISVISESTKMIWILGLSYLR
jgi:hypothetical protein